MNPKTIRRFFEPLFSYKLYTLTLCIEFFLWFAVGFISIFFIKDVTAVLETGTLESFQSTLLWYLIIFLCTEGVTALIMNYGWVRFDETIENFLLRKYLTEFTLLDNTAVEKEGTGKINHVIQQGVKAHTGALRDFLKNMIDILPVSIFTLYFVFGIHFLLGVGLIFLYGLLFLFINLTDRKMVQSRNKKYVFKKETSRIVTKVIMSKFEMLQGGRIQEECNKTYELAQQTIQVNKKFNAWGNVFFRGIEIFLFLLKVAIVFLLGMQYFSGDVSLPYVVMFLTVFLYFERNIDIFLNFYKDFTKNAHEITGLWNFFDSTPQISGYHEGHIFTYEKGDISLHDITYSYTGEKNIFEDFSLSLPGGKITAFVGPSGGGKSTLVKLIAGYIRPDSGEIRIDDQKLSETALKSYYEDIGYLTQEPSVFDGTIRENLLYACEEKEVSEEKLREIIEKSNCEFIFGLPHGIDTEIGERGIRLSGGQKQRLAIAKIFLKDPQIIILDEPTSALDSLSELKISEALKELFRDRTVLIIAHRLQTVKHADMILVLDAGKIIEQGTHEELLLKDGFYKQMLDLQSGF